MNIIAKKEILMNYLNVVQRAVSKNGLVPAMEGILIKASEEGELELSATNGELSIVANAVKCDTWEAGEIILPPKFVNVVKLMPTKMVRIQATPEEAERFRVKVSSGDSNFTLAGLNGNMFPAVSQDIEGVHLQVETKKFKELVSNTIFATAPQSHHPALEGVLIEVEDNKLIFTATDSYRIANDYVDIDTEDTKIVVPAKTLTEINRIITDPDEVINCFITNKEIKFGYKDYVLSSRLLDGEYPDFTKIFPKEHETSAVVDTAEMRDLIARALLIDHKVTIEVNDLFHILAVAEDGKLEEAFEADINGDGLKIALNAHYVNDVLKVINAEKIVIEFNGALGPCVIKVPGTNYRYMVLPIRVN